jgi:hypothetical protein
MVRLLIEIQACGSSNRSYNRGIRSCDWISSIDIDEGRPLARSEDKCRRGVKEAYLSLCI